jgi:VWFA-related protein
MTSQRAAVALVAVVMATVALAQEPVPPPAPRFTSDVEMVVVDVVVAGKDGGPLSGLRAEDFTVTEDGVPQQVVTFEAVDVAGTPSPEAGPDVRPKVSVNTGLQAMNTRTFVLVFDQVHLTPVSAQRAKTAISEFLRFGPREGDTVVIVGTGGGTWWMARADEGRAELQAVLKRLEGKYLFQETPDRITEWEAMRIWEDQDPITLEQVRRRFEAYATGRSRSSEGLPVRATDRIGEGQEFVPSDEIRNRAQEVYQQSVVRNKTTLSGLGRVLDSLSAVRGRKTVVLFSEGFIRDSRLEEYQDVIRSAQRSNVAIYFVDVRGMDAMPMAATAQAGPALPAADVATQRMEELVSAEGADTLAVNTGGFSIKNTNDLERGLLRVTQESRRYYLLGYSPTNARHDGRWRKIEVKVARPGVDVRARKGYYAPGDAKKGRAADRGWRPGLQQALDSPYEFQAIPVRLTHHVFGESKPGKARTLLSGEVDIRSVAFEKSGGRSLNTLESLLVVIERESGEFERQDQKLDLKLPDDVRAMLERQWLPVSREFELAPGRYRAKLVVRDKQSGALGSVSHEFDVPDLRAWRTSSPVLTDALEPRAEGAPLRPVVPARRTFAGMGKLYFQFEVYGSSSDPSGLPRVSSGFAVRAADGTVVTRGPSALIKPTAEGRLARIGAFPLDGLAPGRYDLVLDVRDEVAGRSLEVVEAFAIERPGT